MDKHPGGRPRFKPTEAQRTEVKTLAAVGFPLHFIAEFIGLGSVNTLKTYFPEELKAKTRLLAASVAVLGRALANEKNDPVGARSAAYFLLKTQGKHLGWSERLEVTGKDGRDLIDLTRLSDQELDAFEDLIRKAGGTAPSIPATMM